MLRPAIVLLLAVALQGAHAQQVEPHGPPASVLSPTSPGTGHSVPSSVTSPTPPTNQRSGRVVVNQRRRRVVFGSPQTRRRHEVVPVPIFIPAYPLASDYNDSEQAAAQAPPDDTPDDSGQDSDALRQAYLRGAHDALAQQRDSRYGQHYLDAREQNQSKSATGKSKAAEESADREAPAGNDNNGASETDKGPATVFIFKDGHKIETQNYAIVGETLFDFSDNAMRRIKLTDIDFDATRKANDDLGISVKLPPSTP